MFLFLCTKLFQKRGHYSRGNIISENTVSKDGNTTNSPFWNRRSMFFIWNAHFLWITWVHLHMIKYVCTRSSIVWSNFRMIRMTYIRKMGRTKFLIISCKFRKYYQIKDQNATFSLFLFCWCESQRIWLDFRSNKQMTSPNIQMNYFALWKVWAMHYPCNYDFLNYGIPLTNTTSFALKIILQKI